jgi:hypothetical protein
MLTRDDIAQVERIENAHHKAIHSTFACRNQGPKSWKAWEDATSAWHAQRYPTNKLWEDDFLADLRASERKAIEEAILYLEVDPWYFRSGYLKERLIRGLKAANLTERDRRRLRNVIWNVAAGKNRREYRDYCSLAAVVGDADLIRLLEDVSPERDQDAKGKFGYLLRYLQQNSIPSEQDAPSNGGQRPSLNSGFPPRRG